MQRPRIYVDLDDVLCETARALLALVRREFGRQVAFEDIFSFEVAEAFDLAPHEERRLIDLLHTEDCLLGLEPIAGAAEVLSDWRARGYRVEVVTGRLPASAAPTRRWLERHRVPCDGVLFVDKYNRFPGDAGGEHVLSLEDLRRRAFRLAIDDSAAMARFLSERLAVPTVLFDRPWNAALKPEPAAADRLARCGDWSAIGRRFPNP